MVHKRYGKCYNGQNPKFRLGQKMQAEKQVKKPKPPRCHADSVRDLISGKKNEN